MIIKRKTKGGKARYSVRVDRGKRQVWVGTFDTMAEARKREAKARASGRSGRMNCDAYVDRFLRQYEEGHKTSSVETAKSCLKGFAEDFRGTPLDAVSRVAAKDWAIDNAWRVRVVTTLFNAAKEDGLVDENPFRGLTKRTEGRRRLRPLTVAEVDKLAQSALEVHEDYGPMMRAFIYFLAYSGMRVGEVFALEWTDLDLEAMRIRVERRLYNGDVDVPKSGKARTIVLTPQARDALESLPRIERRIFRGKKGGSLSQPLLTWYWREVTARFGKKVTPHELRHFAGHYLHVTLGLPSRVVAVQLGHDDGGRLVESLYGHGDVGALEEIDRAFANVVPIRKAVGE